MKAILDDIDMVADSFLPRGRFAHQMQGTALSEMFTNSQMSSNPATETGDTLSEDFDWLSYFRIILRSFECFYLDTWDAKSFGLMQSLQLMETFGEFRRDDFPGCQCGWALAARALGRGWRSEMGTQTCRVQSTSSTSSTSSTRHTQFKKEGYFFRHFFLTSFWLLASGFWLAFGFWLLRLLASGLWLVASGFWLHFSMEGIFFEGGTPWGSEFSLKMMIKHCKYQCFMHLEGLKP